MKEITKELLFWAIIVTVIAAGMIWLGGCAASTATIRTSPIADVNEPQAAIEFTGKAADVVAKEVSATIAANLQTKEGRLNELIGVLKKYFGWLFLTLLGGLAFWGFTRSRYGWIVPAVSLAGMAAVLTLSSLAKWIPYIVVAICLGLFIWKAAEYQRERNANGKENKK